MISQFSGYSPRHFWAVGHQGEHKTSGATTLAVHSLLHILDLCSTAHTQRQQTLALTSCSVFGLNILFGLNRCHGLSAGSDWAGQKDGTVGLGLRSGNAQMFPHLDLFHVFCTTHTIPYFMLQHLSGNIHHDTDRKQDKRWWCGKTVLPIFTNATVGCRAVQRAPARNHEAAMFQRAVGQPCKAQAFFSLSAL